MPWSGVCGSRGAPDVLDASTTEIVLFFAVCAVALIGLVWLLTRD
jgi:hypothetical protein